MIVLLAVTLCAAEADQTPAETPSPLSLIKKGSRVIFIGDSITAVYPDQPTYTLPTHNYVTAFDTLFRLKYPELGGQIVSKGIGGQTVRHLSQRWDKDIIKEKPDWLFILIGINDADYLFRFKTNSPKEYEEIYNALLTQTKRKLPNTRVVLMTPFMITRGDPKRLASGFNKDIYGVIDQYVDVVRKLAEKHQLDLIDLDIAFKEVLQYENEEWLAKEPIHPGERGSLFMAMKILQYLEYAPGQEIPKPDFCEYNATKTAKSK